MTGSHFTISTKAHRFEVQSSAPVISVGKQGIVIGHLFKRGELDCRVTQFEPGEIDAIVASSGRSLISDFWGGYVAVVRGNNNEIAVIRDPSGIMPCYWRERDSRILVSNDIESVACWNGPAHVRLPALARYLASPGYNGDETALLDSFELPAGHALIVGINRPAVLRYWSPWDFAMAPASDCAAHIAEHLKHVVTKCVGAWARCFENVVLGVSGGLDSSIVGSICAQHTNLRCLNMYADDAEGDERRYAKLLTDSLGVGLQTGHYRTGAIDVSQPVLPHRPWPNVSFFALGIDAMHRELDRMLAVDAFFSGNGGDNIFCTIRSASPFLDRLLTEGPGLGLKTTLHDLCGLTGADAGTVLKTAWQQYFTIRKGSVAKADWTGLRRDTISSHPLQHPWMVAPLGALPGKIAHVAFLANAQQSHELYARTASAPHVSALLSQPIVELCLSIPSWLWIEGGIDRAVARSAFRDVLPAQLIQRTSKGGPGMFVQNFYRENETRIKALLRNGALVSEGFLDLDFIDAEDDPSWRGNSRVQRLLQFAAAENWCRYWEGRTRP